MDLFGNPTDHFEYTQHCILSGLLTAVGCQAHLIVAPIYVDIPRPPKVRHRSNSEEPKVHTHSRRLDTLHASHCAPCSLCAVICGMEWSSSALTNLKPHKHTVHPNRNLTATSHTSKTETLCCSASKLRPHHVPCASTVNRETVPEINPTKRLLQQISHLLYLTQICRATQSSEMENVTSECANRPWSAKTYN